MLSSNSFSDPAIGPQDQGFKFMFFIDSLAEEIIFSGWRWEEEQLQQRGSQPLEDLRDFPIHSF